MKQFICLTGLLYQLEEDQKKKLSSNKRTSKNDLKVPKSKTLPNKRQKKPK
jgi:hypothetical protein